MSSALMYINNRFKNLTGSDGGEDIRRWNTLFTMINPGVTFMDRTGNLKMPIRTTITPEMRIPTYDPNFSMTYEECCQARVRELLAKQEQLDVPIRLMYSGGIDSSLVLTSFIKELGQAEAEKRLQVFLSMESIEENPWMWERILRRSNFTILNGESHAGDWGKDRIMIGGECNDQVLGSDTYRNLLHWGGPGFLSKPWTETILTEYHMWRGLTQTDAEMWTQLLSDHLRRAPCVVETVADWWWWINFSCKWNFVYYRILLYARDHSHINADYMDNYYYQFYSDDNFQRWSMVDRTHKVTDTWLSYKWHARKLVADLCGDEYNQKLKRGSLWRLLGFKPVAELLDDDFNYVMDVNAGNIDDWYLPDNSFRNI